MAATIDELQIEIQASAAKASAGIDALTASLSGLKGVTKGGAGLTTATKQFERFSAAVNAMQNPSAKVAALVSALKPLESIGKSNLSSALNQLKKIPEITAGLDDAKLSEFAAKITQVTAAIKPLSTEMEKVSQGFSKLPANIQRAINANARLTSSNYRASSSFFKLSSIMAKVYIVKRVAGVIADWIKKSNDYVENLNLFTVAMGKYAESAKEYAEVVQEAVGIDASQFMRYQGVFMNMARGFGVASDKAATMSKNLTQLGYDLASLYNVNFDIAMEKLESALSGQPRPMREWGFDLSEATLKAKALELGIAKNVEMMSQAEKSQIRYVQLLDTARKIGATGDFVRTLETSANQLRILQAQATLAARALGNIFIPALNAILPYAIAFLKVVRMVAQSLANLFGFKMPEIDYSGLDGFASGADDAADAMDNATGSAKKLKGMLAGFDEINVITQPNVGGGGGGGVGGIGGGDLGIALPEYDFLGGVLNDRVNELTEGFKRWLPLIKSVGIALLTAFAAKKIIGIISSLARLKDSFGGTLGAASKVTTGILGFIAAAVLAGTAAYALTINGMDPLLSGFLSFIVVAPLVGLVLSNLLGPIGWVIAGIGALVGAIAGVMIAQEQLQEEATLAAFFDGEGVSIDVYVDKVKAIAQTYTDTYAPIAEWGKAFDSNATSIQGTWAEIDVLMSRMNYAAETITDEDIEQLKTAFTELHKKAKEQLELVGNIIITNLQNTFSDAAKQAGINVDILIGEVARLQLEIGAKTDAVYSEMMAVADGMKGLDPTSPKYKELQDDLNRLAIEYAGLTATVDLATTKWNNARDGFDATKIDFTDVDVATRALGDMAASAGDAMAALDEAHIASLNAIDTLQAQAIAAGTYDSQVFAQLRAAVNADYDANKAQMESEFKAISEEIWSAYNTQFESAFNERFANATDWDKAMAAAVELSGRGTYEEALHTIILQETTDALGGVTDAIKSFDVAAGVPSMEKMGENLMSTLAGVIKTEGGKPVTELGAVLDAMIKAAETKMEIGSPSKLFERYGRWYMEGLSGGISGSGTLVTDSISVALGLITQPMTTVTSEMTDAGKSIIGNLADGIRSAAPTARSAFESIFDGVKLKLPHFSFAGSFDLEKQKVPTVKVKWYGEGGFPEPGELFIARESGPEMVGTMGGRTAVANNDQIVEAVSQGVYRAVSGAMSGQGGTGDVYVYIGGEQLDAHVVRAQNRTAVRSNGRA